MIKLYRFIYYMGSYFIRKYDHLWKIGHYYYIWSGCICGAILFLSVWVIFNVLFLLGLSPIVFMNYYYSGLLSIIFDIIICLYLRKNKRYKTIYKEEHERKRFSRIVLAIVSIMYSIGMFIGVLVTDDMIIMHEKAVNDNKSLNNISICSRPPKDYAISLLL